MVIFIGSFSFAAFFGLMVFFGLFEAFTDWLSDRSMAKDRKRQDRLDQEKRVEWLTKQPAEVQARELLLAAYNKDRTKLQDQRLALHKLQMESENKKIFRKKNIVSYVEWETVQTSMNGQRWDAKLNHRYEDKWRKVCATAGHVHKPFRLSDTEMIKLNPQFKPSLF